MTIQKQHRLDGWPEEVSGNGAEVPVVGGRVVPYAYLDNAASTPALVAVREAVDSFLPWYSSVHRGTGYKSRVATAAYEQARQRVRRFLNVAEDQAVVFVKNSTEGLNRISHLLQERGVTVFSSIMEHHANMLPWRFRAAATRMIRVDAYGIIDEDDLRTQLRSAPPGPKLVALSGAYNVTGYTPPIHRIARLAHEHGAEVLVDGAQLVSHRPLDVQGAGPEERIDYLVFSAHKIYAPLGSGAMLAPMAALDAVGPDLLGGGIVDMVTLDEVVWNDLPDREEAGSPNVVGAVALGAALGRLEELGRHELEDQEAALTAYTLDRMGRIPGVRVLGPPSGPDRIGVISFVVDGLPHGLVAAALSYEHGIGVRSGCFCAHPGVLHLLDLQVDEVKDVRTRLRRHEHWGIPGSVRVSLGLQNTRREIDRFVDGLTRIASGDLLAAYTLDRHTGDYHPEGWLDKTEARIRAQLSAW